LKEFDPQGHKGQKNKQRPHVSKLDFQIFKGLTMVSQHSKGSYKVPWSPIGIRFWERQPQNQKRVPRVKISSDKKILNIKKIDLSRTFNFDIQNFFVRWNFFTRGTLFWFWSCRFSKPYPDWPSRHFIWNFIMLGDHC
jgi:hypothetical protein